ncbi:dihydrodipicolinate synthase family protein [Paenibacillus mucilaginosus]|uniref:Dihydrodipicolinate synthetase n=1 Tax=Paenibacillus mucilaginosus (strain KNP414) TaxID=1036673 RepID=F8FFX2_PAEMK|nr:dihydrodipicolinate synthase family protein [Paenibacillus mucilaginosus]AEI43234.1 dihydrodipicolinate synthetase [Paenibacillus mucilaginosus KNP414]MCG7212210.1 dihydrodipicolinate synthase family protein [Paenibacillus mucilaginosus]WDM24823.1 dihydrodipicolinate synthase family protein [Paenibacillus mucilaginosus]
MRRKLQGGVWPTMLTPFTKEDKVDYEALGRLVEWYIDRGVHGLFAVCQSSEMFRLTLGERAGIAEFVVKKAAGRVPVVASGHIADSPEDQAAELTVMAGTGIDALVLITNRLAGPGDPDEVMAEQLQRLIERLPQDLPLGMYECPYPYKRLISPELLKWCADSGRFQFLKDTCCDLETLRLRMDAVRGSGLQIYNANSATLLESLPLGIAGYSGVMANFHPELYVWLLNRFREEPEETGGLMDFLSVAAWVEKQLYPVSAKYYLKLEGVLDHWSARTADARDLTATHRLELEQLRRLTETYRRRIAQ